MQVTTTAGASGVPAAPAALDAGGEEPSPLSFAAGLGAAALALALAIYLVRLVLAPAPAAAAPAAALSARPDGATREITLTAKEVDWEIMPGTVVRAWTYNGTMPGPEIRVTEGDLVRVTLRNELPVPTTIHWHGIDVPNAMDGVPGLTQPAVPPGGVFTYEFTATNPGTRWYHSHQDPEVQDPLGLYGPFIVEPKTPPAGAVTYNREFTYLLSEWSLALTPAVATGDATLPLSGPGAPHAKQLDYDFFLMNGKAHDAIAPVAVKQGERIRIRIINAGALVHTMHTHGHSFKIVATDGNFVPPANQLVKDSVTIGPSERVDIEILASNPGVWMFHCHMQHHAANGMMTSIRYEGVGAPAASGHDGHDGRDAAVVAFAGGGGPVAPVLNATDPAVLAASAKISMVDNRFQPPAITVPVGATVAWINNGANVHTVSSYDGTIESGAVSSGKAFTVTFTRPGQYQYLCRQHFLSGMAGIVIVQ